MKTVNMNEWRPISINALRRSLPTGIPIRAMQGSLKRNQIGQGDIPSSLAIPVSLLELAISSGIAWVGFHTGINEKGILSIAGYTVGVVGGISALFGLGDVAVSVASFAKPKVSTTSEGTA